MECRGFILDGSIERNKLYKSNGCLMNKTDETTFHFFKEATTHPIHFLWCGFKIQPKKVKTIMKFDIMFVSEVPNKEDNCYIKQHDPEEAYTEWLSHCKKGAFVHVEQTLFMSKNEQLVIFIMDHCYRPVEFILKNVEFVPCEINYKFISFYTQGPPRDNCFNLTEEAAAYRALIENYVDSTRFYNAAELRNDKETEYTVKEFQCEPHHNPKTNLIGYLRWKPYIILKTLLESNEGDIIYYRDSNITKYPGIKHGINSTSKTLNYVLDGTDIFAPIETYPYTRMTQHVKREVFEHFKLYGKHMKQPFLFNASVVACRKNESSVQFVTEWLETCKNDELISSSHTLQQHRDFLWNTQEQSIMNVLFQKYYDDDLYKINRYSMQNTNRLLDQDNLRKVNRVAILLCGEMRNFDHVEMNNLNNKYLFDLFNCDLFVSTWDERGTSITVSEKNYKNENINEARIRTNYKNVKKINIDNFKGWFDDLPESHKELYHAGNGTIAKATAIPQLYKLWDCNRLKTEFEKEHNFTYDVVIRFRPDFCLVQEIPDFLPCYRLDRKIFSLNPPKISYPNRIYDIFFYGNSSSMDSISNAWTNIIHLTKNDFQNGLSNVDACRLLYVQCLLDFNKPVEIHRCIGDIYRDEPIQDYLSKIKNVFN